MSKEKFSSSRVAIRKRKRRRLKKRVYIFLVICLVLFLSVFTYAAYLYVKAGSVFSDSFEDDGREKSDLRENTVDPAEDNVSILIIGADESEERNNKGASRSDALMVATLNNAEKSVKLVSIPRDSLVYVPEVGYETKINHAYAYGGARASVETVENLLDIPIDYYFTLNFEAFIDVVDALGGITVEVPYELYEQDSRGTKDAIHLLPGEQELDGEEALALARTRKLDNDIERGKRQQEIIKAAMKKAISLGSIFKYDDVIQAVGDNMKTNMLFSEMKSFISYGTNAANLNIETYTLEGSDYHLNGVYYWKLDDAALETTKQMLKTHLDL